LIGTDQNWRCHVKEHKEKLDFVAEKLDFSSFEDWSKITRKKLNEFGCSDFISQYYQGSYVKAISSVYSAHAWLPWKFSKIPHEFWKEMNNQRFYIECMFASQFSNIIPKDLLSMKTGEIMKILPLLPSFSLSKVAFLEIFFPEIEWFNISILSPKYQLPSHIKKGKRKLKNWTLRISPRITGISKDVKLQRGFIYYFCDFQIPSHFYRLNVKKLLQFEGSSFLNSTYGRSEMRTITS